MGMYKGYKLSQFQIDAIKGILKGDNVIVSTHTGNGKTLIADFAINECYKKGEKVVYTAPIKALSNQKYNQFKKEYGDLCVGLITGDRVINSSADILVVTTEVLRNMIQENQEDIEDIKYIILDEIHYISNEERGMVWEEIIIFKPKKTRIIGLSAAIPNIDEFCDWILSIHGESVTKVYYPKRIVEQKHYYFDKKIKKASYEDIVQNYLFYKNTFGRLPCQNTHLDFVKYAIETEILPILCFVFSRKECEEKALELSYELDLLNVGEKEKISSMVELYEGKFKELKKSYSWMLLKQVISCGIGFHHAGLLPIIKEFMENLFEQNLCKVLYATETFAVGINYPVKTVLFNSLRKYDGKAFRNLSGSEYLQMAGRAGRRNLDSFGLVFTLTDYRAIEGNEFLDIGSLNVEPVKSQFKLSYNTVLNLARKYTSEDIRLFFKKSFANYQYDKKLHQLKKELKDLKKKYFLENNQSCFKYCPVEDIDRCPIFYDKNKSRLEMYQLMLKRKTVKQKDLIAIQKKVYELKKKTSKMRAECSKSVIKQCMEFQRKIDKQKREIERKERFLDIQQENTPEVAFIKDYEKKINLLKKLKFMTDDNKLLPRGEACCRIHIQELLVTELIFSGFFHENHEDIINGIVAGIACDIQLNHNNGYSFSFDTTQLLSLIEHITKQEIAHGLESSIKFTSAVCGIIEAWSRGEDLFEITKKTSLSEGDIVSICRRTLDLLRQIQNSFPEDFWLKSKITNCITKLDRGIVSVGL